MSACRPFSMPDDKPRRFMSRPARGRRGRAMGLARVGALLHAIRIAGFCWLAVAAALLAAAVGGLVEPALAAALAVGLLLAGAALAAALSVPLAALLLRLVEDGR